MLSRDCSSSNGAKSFQISAYLYKLEISRTQKGSYSYTSIMKHQADAEFPYSLNRVCLDHFNGACTADKLALYVFIKDD